jgi:hypothetical protein
MNTARTLAELLEILGKDGNPSDRISDRWVNLLQVSSHSAAYNLALASIQSRFEQLQWELSNSTASERNKNLFIGAAGNLLPFVRSPELYNLNVQHLLDVKTHLDILFMAADVLPDHLVPEINSLTIDALVKELQSLRDECQASEMDERLRGLVVEQLDRLLVAIRAYTVIGPEAAATLYGAAAASLGRLAKDNAEQAPTGRAFVNSALSICKKAGAAVIFLGGVVHGAHEMLEDGSALLGIEQSNGASEE